ncbi:MAG: hypothetical protein ACRD6W_16155 [Nitrososphaerales archaeon]
MGDSHDSVDKGIGGRKAYSASIRVEVPSTASCSFCWFVLKLYPTLKAMTERDTETFRAHLEKVHGLSKEIEP